MNAVTRNNLEFISACLRLVNIRQVYSRMSKSLFNFLHQIHFWNCLLEKVSVSYHIFFGGCMQFLIIHQTDIWGVLEKAIRHTLGNMTWFDRQIELENLRSWNFYEFFFFSLIFGGGYKERFDSYLGVCHNVLPIIFFRKSDFEQHCCQNVPC